MIFRRLKSCTKNRFFGILLFICLVFGLIIFFETTNICFQSKINSKIYKLCLNYDKERYSGTLCHEICTQKIINNFKCGHGNYDDNHIFFANLKDKTLLLKQIVPTQNGIEDLIWIDKNGNKKYPSINEFTQIIRRTLFFTYNLTLTPDKLANFLDISENSRKDKIHYHMQLLYNTVRNNEYILTNFLDTEEIFPKILGKCADIYAREFVLPMVKTGQSGDVSSEDWKTRVKAAILIMDFIEELNSYQTPLVMCNIDINYFAISDDRMKYHDVSNIYTSAYIDKILNDGKACTSDKDCNYLKCQGKCDIDANKCIHKQINNNLQIVCDQLFRGESYSPGILITSRTSKTLKLLIDRCANPIKTSDIDEYRPLGPSKQLRTILYAELTNLIEILVTQQQH